MPETKNANIPVTETKKKAGNSVSFYVLTIITALLMVCLIVGGGFFFAIKKNFNGVADSMRDTIVKIPILNLALPDIPEPDDEKNMSEAQVRQKYTQIKDEKKLLEKQIQDANEQIEAINKQLSAKDTDSNLLQQQKAALESEKLKLLSENDSLQKDMKEIASVIANGDAKEYKKYFEKINPTMASELYSEVIKAQKISDEVKKYCSIYEEMDADAVSTIMEEMGSGKMALIIEIMKNLKKDTAAEILSSMTPEFAAKVSEQLAKEYNLASAVEKEK